MTTNTANPFVGKTVVATGKLQNYTRDGIQMKLLSLGGQSRLFCDQKDGLSHRW